MTQPVEPIISGPSNATGSRSSGSLFMWYVLVRTWMIHSHDKKFLERQLHLVHILPIKRIIRLNLDIIEVWCMYKFLSHKPCPQRTRSRRRQTPEQSPYSSQEMKHWCHEVPPELVHRVAVSSRQGSRCSWRLSTRIRGFLFLPRCRFPGLVARF